MGLLNSVMDLKYRTNVHIYTVTGQLWSLSTTTLQVRLRIQLNSILFAKTLARKDVASSGASAKDTANTDSPKTKEEEDDFSSKAQIMSTLR